MNVSELKTGMGFVSDCLPLDRAVLCGIEFTGIETKEVKGQIVKQACFKRRNGGEVIGFGIDAEGNLNMGHWIPYKQLQYASAFVLNCQEAWEHDQQALGVAQNNIALLIETREEVLKRYMTEDEYQEEGAE